MEVIELELNKICKKCNKKFYKKKNRGIKQFNKQIYCSSECRVSDKQNIEYECKNCHIVVLGYKSDKRKFCSIKCKKDYTKKENRVCKKCKKEFTILSSALKTNSSGNFCSRDCYNKFLCNTERKTGRGTQWNKTRKEVKNKFNFCGICGTSKKLQVHHIVPFRISFDNSHKNLIPLCVKCHKKVEMITVDLINSGFESHQVFNYMSFILRDRQLLTAYKIKEAKC